MKIKRHVIAGIERHAWESVPTECCGLLAGQGDIIEQIYRLKNVAATPETRYFADPKEIVRALKLVRSRGEEQLGIYHSHTRSAAYPSATDVDHAYYSEAAYFIISLAPKLQLRAFRIRTGLIEEIDYTIVDD